MGRYEAANIHLESRSELSRARIAGPDPNLVVVRTGQSPIEVSQIFTLSEGLTVLTPPF